MRQIIKVRCNYFRMNTCAHANLIEKREYYDNFNKLERANGNPITSGLTVQVRIFKVNVVSTESLTEKKKTFISFIDVNSHIINFSLALT